MSKKGRVLMAMSGGLDSSIAGMMLHEEGYEVIGMTMKTWEYETSEVTAKETGCCSLDSINDARNLAVKLGFPHYVIDIREEFNELIVKNFVDEYMVGRTPNPCVLCNTHIKWAALLKRADQMGCEFISTGHYARVREENGRYVVSKGKDEDKDQSYVLWGVSQENLKRTILPLGGFLKSEIREMAKKYGFEKLANKRESFEICFIPDDDYRSFLKRNVNNLEKDVAGGDFISTDGKILGKHKGFPFYTIGQRKGLEIALGEPMYVKSINAENNTVMLGRSEDIYSNSMIVKNFNLQKYPEIKGEMKVLTKIRYHDKGTLSTIKQIGDKIFVEFQEPVSAVAPGQSAVFYEGDDVIGGGFID
ncbi:MAG: tRNA 2-thiouridine(34) synthase MnmA [Saprospiraceae bacterium]|nr:tRNA 2-thiouridine(34) synthase MnmA [Saprospiraceae bacterium]